METSLSSHVKLWEKTLYDHLTHDEFAYAVAVFMVFFVLWNKVKI